MELIEKLGIDGKVLIAQIVNFFLLLVILYKLLYKPILDVLEKRRKKIQKSLKEAKEIEIRIEKVDQEIDEKLTSANKEANRIMADAEKKAETIKEKMKDEAKEQVSKLKEKARLEIQEEKEGLVQEAKQEIAELVVALSTKILKRELTDSDEQKIIQEIESIINKENNNGHNR